MRDRSAAYWFSVGDKVKVIDDVYKMNKNLNGRIGVVTETWEKCEVDPTCCCAEQVDTNMAVRVRFEDDDGLMSSANNTLFLEPFFFHYFAEEELEKVKEESENNQVAFDGLTCKAFKLDKLSKGQSKRSIYSYEPSVTDTSEEISN